MYINTVDSLKDSFTSFKRTVYAYVWVQVKEYAYIDGEEYSTFIFRVLVMSGEDEITILEKANKELRSLYSEDGYIITNIVPFKEILSRELKKEHKDVIEKFC